MAGANNNSKHFNLPWHQYDQYWISVGMKNSALPIAVGEALQKAGMQAAGNLMTLKTGRDWKKSWDAIYTQIGYAGALQSVEVSVIPGEAPVVGKSVMDWKTAASMQQIAESLWLGDALMEDRLMCYLQPVVSARDKVFGYESFARAQGVGGEVIGGDKIMEASRALGIEYMIDRHLHVQAITTFVCSDFDGFLFVNLSPGFIHRPAVYLEGLSETAANFGIVSKHVVLDFTRSETPRDLVHLKSICEYGRTRGYSIALDDIESMEGARKLVPDIRPDFVKIDRNLACKYDEPTKRDTISRIVELVHKSGGTVIAEGVETEAAHLALKALGVDLFQGYYFSPPVPVEVVIKKITGTK